MGGAGLLTLAAMLAALPFAVLADLFNLFGTVKNYSAKWGPREAALAEASHGAAMIVLPVLVQLRLGGVLPSWSLLAVLALVIWGILKLFNGAKFSVGWRDPKLIARAAIKTALAVLFRAIDARQFGNLDPMINALLSLVGWWLLVTGLTKLLLVLRGFPQPIWVDPGTPHGKAGFSKPDDPGWKL